MSKLLRGNFKLEKEPTLDSYKEEKSASEKFEEEALKKIGGSTAYVMKQGQEQQASWLNTISDSTWKIKSQLWKENLRGNREIFYGGFVPRLNELTGSRKGQKCLIVGGGPSLMRSGGCIEKIVDHREDICIIACDGASRHLKNIELNPDYIVSVDGDPIVTEFYSRLGITFQTTALLNPCVHPTLTLEVMRRKWPIYWWQPFSKEDKRSMESGLYTPDLTWLRTGGNVGTTCWMMASEFLQCSPIGLIGIEFAWSDETPYQMTQYWDHLVKAVGEERAPRNYKRIVNPRDGKEYIADPVYYAYSIWFKDLFSNSPEEVRKKTFTLTKEGILHGEGAPEYMDLQRFLEL